jgi:RNase P subunit RPR2
MRYSKQTLLKEITKTEERLKKLYEIYNKMNKNCDHRNYEHIGTRAYFSCDSDTRRTKCRDCGEIWDYHIIPRSGKLKLKY